jgi:hypothetical protein
MRLRSKRIRILESLIQDYRNYPRGLSVELLEKRDAVLNAIYKLDDERKILRTQLNRLMKIRRNQLEI